MEVKKSFDDQIVNQLVAQAKAWWESHPPGDEYVPARSWEWETQGLDSPMKVAAWIMHLERDGAMWHMDDNPHDCITGSGDGRFVPSFTPEQADALKRLQDWAWDICGAAGIDIHSIALAITFPEAWNEPDEPVPAPAESPNFDLAINAEDLLERFADPDYPITADDVEPEDSTLRDLACPSCGQRGHLAVEITVMAALSRDGSETYGDHEWTDSSAAECRHCGYRGALGGFRFPGLDELIARRVEK